MCRFLRPVFLPGALVICFWLCGSADASNVTYQEAYDFLEQFMPLHDRLELSKDFIDWNIRQSFSTLKGREWSADIPDDIFLDYILPYSSMDEIRDGWRYFFQTVVDPIVANASSTSSAALLVNKKVWSVPGFWDISFKPNQTPEIMSPIQVAEAGFASCTGLSIFLVSALRSVGIPARVTGTPAWKRGKTGVAGGNHDWVEVYDKGVWSFTGPTEYTKEGWNKTWFFPEPASGQVPGSRKHGIFATSWRTTWDGYFPLTWAPNVTYVNAIDVTNNYVS